MKIYIVGHKPLDYGYWCDYPYIPIQVGNAETFLDLRDNTGDNISEWNPVYAENTGLYWVWKHADDDILGVCQYRRRIEVPEGAFDTYDAVVCKPIFVGNVRHQYSVCHCAEDLDIAKEIIEKKFPEFLDAFNSVMNGGKLYFSNRFVLKKELFMEYCEFLFGICDEFRKIKGWNTVEDASKSVDEQMKQGKRDTARGLKYQQQVFGFLSERLFTVWLEKSVSEDKLLVTNGVFFENL